MKLSIKNARRLETEILNQIDRLTDKVSFSSHGERENTFESACKKKLDSVMISFHNIKQLIAIRMIVRKKIGEFNSKSGINDLSADIAEKEAILNVVEALSHIGSPSERELKNETVFLPGISENDRESFYADSLRVKREIVRLKDKCQGINSGGTIEIDSKSESYLKKSGLID